MVVYSMNRAQEPKSSAAFFFSFEQGDETTRLLTAQLGIPFRSCDATSANEVAKAKMAEVLKRILNYVFVS